MNIGLQLYSVKEETAADFFGTLEKIKGFGYTGVEFAGYGEISARDMKNKLDELNLKAVGSHISLDRFKNNFDEEMEYNLTVGNEYLICPYAKFDDIKSVRDVIDTLNLAAKLAKERGLKVGYHNHAHEFEKFDGEYILDILIKETTDVIFQIDVFWVAKAGLDPIKYIEKWGDRIELVHLKQIGSDGRNVELADGNIDMKKVVKASKFAKHFVVEQEEYAVDAMTSAASGAKFMLAQLAE